jgi:hypothetical protein
VFAREDFAGANSAIDLGAKVAHVVGNEIAPDPSPERRERGARDPALPFVLGFAIDQERLDRLKEQARGVAFSGRRIARVANGSADRIQQHFPAWDVFAPQHRAFELHHQQSSRTRRQLPQVRPQSLD